MTPNAFKSLSNIILFMYLLESTLGPQALLCFAASLISSRLDQLEFLVILQVVLGASLYRFTIVQLGLDCKVVQTGFNLKTIMNWSAIYS